jgi:transposase
MVFLDESLFNKITGWRLHAWAPIGQPGRYTGDRTRSVSWSFLAAYTTKGYLPSWQIKKGYYNHEAFLKWLTEELLPNCRPGNVIIINNCNTHIHPDVERAITSRECLIRYLPPYSPDFNPIELSFSVLKAYVRRRFRDIWPTFEGTFGYFLAFCVIQSRCDRFAEAHFKHSDNGGYVFDKDMDILDERLRAYENERRDDFDI